MDVSHTALPAFAASFVSHLPQKPLNRAYLVGLKGELGAGKTTFVQEVGKALGITPSITSPTFVIARAYPIPAHPVFFKLIHIDLYRLSPGGTDTYGFGSYLADPTNLVVVEWPEHLSGNPVIDKSLEFRVKSEDTREIIET